MTASWWVVLVVLLLAVAFVVGGLVLTPTKRFGLKEARAALGYVRGDGGGPQVAKAILGVVVGVLNYQNTVAGDVKAETTQLTDYSSRRSSEIADDRQIIVDLQAKIGQLQAANTKANKQAEELHEIADVFNG